MMAVQSQSHSGRESAKSCSDNDNIELEWYGYIIAPALMVTCFMSSILAMSVLQEV